MSDSKDNPDQAKPMAGKLPANGSDLKTTQAEAGREHSSEVFHIVNSYQVSCWIGVGRTIIPFVVGIFVANSSNLKLSDKAPLIFLAAFVWFVIELWGTLKVARFAVELTPDGIKVGSDYIKWADIANSEKTPTLLGGMRPVIILTATDNRKIEIPYAIDGLEYIWVTIGNRVGKALKVDETKGGGGAVG